MSIIPEKTIAARINSASHGSPIAVFTTRQYNRDNGLTLTVLDAVFANTYATRDRILAGDPNFIGSFHGAGGAERFNRRIK